MIPLGSCTMKLNATTEMEPISLPGFADLHPFAPAEDAAGYTELVADLEGWLAEVTGYDEVSIQPNAGSQGELAGLLAIRGYHHANGPAAARRLPDPVVGARHQRRLGGDGRACAWWSSRPPRTARSTSTTCVPSARSTPTTWPRSW